MNSEDNRALRDMADTAHTALIHARDFRDELAAIQARAACLQALELDRIATALETLARLKEHM